VPRLDRGQASMINIEDWRTDWRWLAYRLWPAQTPAWRWSACAGEAGRFFRRRISL